MNYLCSPDTQITDHFDVLCNILTTQRFFISPAGRNASFRGFVHCCKFTDVNEKNPDLCTLNHYEYFFAFALVTTSFVEKCDPCPDPLNVRRFL